MKIFLYAIVLFVLSYLINLFLHPYLSQSYCKYLLSDPKNHNNDLVYKLLSANYSNRRIFRSLALPIPGRDGEEIRVGTVVVNRLGVYIICQIHGGGLVDNQIRANWRHMVNGKCAEFQNPFQAQEDARNLISFYAKNIGISDIRVHSLVIYTDESLKFTQGQNRAIINAANLNKKLSIYNKMGKLNSKQISIVCKMLSDLDEGICV